MLTRDDPAEAILALAEDKDVDLVAMTTRLVHGPGIGKKLARLHPTGVLRG